MSKPKRQSLGKGLNALFEDNKVMNGNISLLRLSEIEPNKNQPRSDFDEQSLRELADSIAEHGVLQPLVVRQISDSVYQIVAGERRWRASRMAGLSEIPVIIREFSDSQTLEIAIIENLQREDLNPVELGCGYQALMNDHNLTQEEVAKKVGKSRSVIANTLRLLNLPPQILDTVRSGVISQGHARALLGIKDEELLLEAADRIAREGLSVREVERIAQEEEQSSTVAKEKTKKEAPAASWGEDSFYKEIQIALSSELGRKVNITHDETKGKISLEFYNKEDLSELAQMITKK